MAKIKGEERDQRVESFGFKTCSVPSLLCSLEQVIQLLGASGVLICEIASLLRGTARM